MERMYTINEIARELGVSRRSVHEWLADGDLKGFHLGGKRLTRVWEKDLLKFIRQRAKKSKGR